MTGPRRATRRPAMASRDGMPSAVEAQNLSPDATAAVVEAALRAAFLKAGAAADARSADAMARVQLSQGGLIAELGALDAEMERVTAVVEGVSLDPETSRLMDLSRESLQRTKKKLNTVRGRLGRLRTHEESDRLRLAHPVAKPTLLAGEASSVQREYSEPPE